DTFYLCPALMAKSDFHEHCFFRLGSITFGFLPTVADNYTCSQRSFLNLGGGQLRQSSRNFLSHSISDGDGSRSYFLTMRMNLETYPHWPDDGNHLLRGWAPLLRFRLNSTGQRLTIS